MHVASRVCMWLALGACVGAKAPPQGTLPFDLWAANNQGRPLIVELSATWCKPCQMFQTMVLSDPRVKEALRDVVFVTYDIDTPAGRDAMERSGIRSVPAVLGIDRDGVVRVAKIGTEPTPDEFLVFMQRAHTILSSR